MLTIRAAKGADYYERAEFARDDYYAERGQVRGTWEGRGAEALGLTDAPGDGALGALLEGRDPASGEDLPGRRNRRGGNVAFDLTFAAPKGLSVLAAVGDEAVRAAILSAYAEGVRAALDYLERRACFVRRGHNGVRVLRAEGFVGAMYLHEMARSGDPHLHAHLVLANRVRGEDGRWTAPDMRPVFAEAKTAGFIAEAVARARLSETLGLEWEQTANGSIDLVAMPASVREHFSSRHAEIVELAHARGYTGASAIEAIQRETRDRKRVVSRERAAAEWRARAAEHGFGAREVARATGAARSRSRTAYVEGLRECRRRMESPAGLTQRASSFTRREVIQDLADAHPEGIGAHALERLADDFLAARCVPLAPAGAAPGRGYEEARYTTPDMLDVETRLIDTACAAPIDPRLASPLQVERAIGARRSLGDDQAAAVRHLCSGEARTRLMEARAGSGKTFALEAVREAYESSGVAVVGTAWQAQAAEVLQRDAGIASETTALILERAARGQDAIPGGAVVVCDEASTMPTRALERLVQVVASRGGRLILVGDRAQLPPVDAGGGFAALCDRLGSVELTENRRQRTELQRAVAERLAEGRAGDAISLLAENGRLRTFEDGADARRALIRSWAQTSLADPADAVILAHDRREVRLLNEMARAELDRAGRLSDRRLVAEGREWAIGDRLLCRRNDYRLDVRNGTRGVVVGLDENERALTLWTDDGREVVLPAVYLRHAERGYAMTGHVSQGTTVDRTYLLATPERGGTEWAYVAGSRQRIDLEVYAIHPDPETLAVALERAWSRTQAKGLAIDIVAAGDRGIEETESARGLTHGPSAGSKPDVSAGRALSDPDLRLAESPRPHPPPVPERGLGRDL
ncbi:MobF family relaxase [Miltoncostaea marina]|uniref:MobF family relaxase n=1 Tax=Miltoncostaea marina TaxID=2843215 RepID=UPI001C3CCDAE|nr:MobF family relaxase [Miltoncostaea marina]